MESTVKRHEKIRDFILYEVMVARFTAYHCVCMQMQQTQKGTLFLYFVEHDQSVQRHSLLR